AGDWRTGRGGVRPGAGRRTARCADPGPGGLADGQPDILCQQNNNYAAAALPGALANPTPGTIVIHVNGKVQTEIQASWTSVDQRFVTAPAGLGTAGATSSSVFSAGLGVNGTGVVKLAPIAINEFARLYFGADGMATNGLRYGAAIELRQNFTGQISSNS